MEAGGRCLGSRAEHLLQSRLPDQENNSDQEHDTWDGVRTLAVSSLLPVISDCR